MFFSIPFFIKKSKSTNIYWVKKSLGSRVELIVTKEFLFAEKEGLEALETLFENEDIDIFDLGRISIL